MTLRTPGEARAAGVKLPAETLARIEADVAAGNVVVVPKRPAVVDGRPFAGWWRIDPSTGTTLDIGETGAGVSAFEYIDPLMNGAAFATLCAMIAAADRRRTTWRGWRWAWRGERPPRRRQPVRARPSGGDSRAACTGACFGVVFAIFAAARRRSSGIG